MTTPVAATDVVLIDRHESGVAVVTLSRPDKLNAVDAALSKALLSALREVEKDPAVRAVLLTGNGRGFCAGQDLQDRAVSQEEGQRPSLGHSIRTRYTPLIRQLRGMKKPVVCAINGIAAGAGASLAFACDFRIASSQAGFIQAFIKIGLIPDSGACFLLPRLVGLGRATELMMTGRKVDAGEALAIGLVQQVVAPEELLPTALAFAESLAVGPTGAYSLLKRALDRAMSTDLDSYLDYEADLQEIAGRTDDFGEGVAAFGEKRPPRFTGH